MQRIWILNAHIVLSILCYTLIRVLVHISDWKLNEYKSDYNKIIDDFAYKARKIIY
jgi:hypothetical protein